MRAPASAYKKGDKIRVVASASGHTDGRHIGRDGVVNYAGKRLSMHPETETRNDWCYVHFENEDVATLFLPDEL